MSKVAFLGLGAMGSRMAANLLKAGHELTVWNMTPEPTNKLAASGAKAASTPREAAEGNDFIIAMVSNDVASRNIWLDRSKGALAGAKAGAIAIKKARLSEPLPTKNLRQKWQNRSIGPECLVPKGLQDSARGFKPGNRPQPRPRPEGRYPFSVISQSSRRRPSSSSVFRVTRRNFAACFLHSSLFHPGQTRLDPNRGRGRGRLEP